MLLIAAPKQKGVALVVDGRRGCRRCSAMIQRESVVVCDGGYRALQQRRIWGGRENKIPGPRVLLVDGRKSLFGNSFTVELRASSVVVDEGGLTGVDFRMVAGRLVAPTPLGDGAG